VGQEIGNFGNQLRKNGVNVKNILSALALGFVLIASNAVVARAGQEAAAAPSENPASAKQQTPGSDAAPLRLTLQDALALARKNSTQFQAALTNAGLAREDQVQARDALLPSAIYNNQALITQSNSNGSVRFIANNSVHEYISQGNVHEVIDLAGVSNLRRASAAAAVARAQAEIASRGLVVTVVQGYYGVAAAQQKLETAKKTAEEGERFLKLTQQLESGGEVAHSDVIKAELQMQERKRQFHEAQLGLKNARLDLAVLIFPDFNDNYEVADDLHASVALPTLGEVQQQAAHENPEVRAALAAVQEAGHDVTGARSGYLPSLSLDYFYGIDATRFATRTDGLNNLGSSGIVALNIPIWNWGATQSKVRQAELRQTQAKRELSLSQRKLLAEIQSLYAEAETSWNELGGLGRSADLAAESLRLTTLRYQDGEATVLEVVDAQTTFAQANAAYQDGAVRYRVALANLQTLTGVLTSP
jgi:outer membrane protein TolC